MFSSIIKRLSVCLILACASPAAATQYRITYSGTLIDGVDDSGVFGTAGANLAGLSYVTQYLLDTDVGATTSSSPTVSRITGTGVNSPLRASLTINGITFQFGYRPLTSSTAEHINSTFDSTSHSINDFNNGVYFNTIFNSITNPSGIMLSSSSYTQALAYTVLPTDNTNGQFVIFEGANFARGNTNVQTLVIAAVPGAVPEVSTWMTLIVGFSVAGGALRRRPSGVRLA